MAQSIDVLKAKARGIVEGITHMPPDERNTIPNGEVADDYNALRRMAIEASPQLKEAMPPQVPTYLGGHGRMFSRSTFGEIMMFANEILALLSAGDGQPTSPVEMGAMVKGGKRVV